MEIKNAIITSATISNDEHGFLSACLQLDNGDFRQKFEWHALYMPKDCKYHNLLSPAGHFIWRCMEVAEVGRWAELRGKTIRVKADHGLVHAIGHIVKDDWFCPKDDFDEHKKGDKISKLTKRRLELLGEENPIICSELANYEINKANMTYDDLLLNVIHRLSDTMVLMNKHQFQRREK